MREKTATKPVHPVTRVGRRSVVVGTLFILAALGAGLTSEAPMTGVPVAALLGVAGGLLVWHGSVLRAVGIANAILTESYALLTRGKLDDAERAHAALPASTARNRAIARALSVQRAQIALARGDSEAALRHANDALADRRVGLLTSDGEKVSITEALGLRAVARAALGEVDSVSSDVAEIEASRYARPAPLARARLAQAVVLARRGERPALAEHLAAHAGVILEHVMPRERSLVRALRALARSSGKSVYREAARPGPEATEASAVREWIARVAPDAAAFAPREVFVELDAAPAAVDPGALRDIAADRRVAAARVKERSPALVVGLWVVLVALFLAIWQFLTPAAPNVADGGRDDEPTVTEPRAVQSSGSTSALGTPFLAFAAGLVAAGAVIARGRRYNRAAIAAERALALGDDRTAERIFRAHTKARFALVKASAHLQLAALAVRRGSFGVAIDETDAGIAVIASNTTAKAMGTDAIAPGLIAERAFALAAVGRLAEAETELATMTAAYPSYFRGPRATFGVRLVSAIRRGDLREAARVARSRGSELPLDLRTDLLADVVLAATGEPTSTDERERIDAELRAMPDVATWIDAIAPDLTRRAVQQPAIRVDAPVGADTEEAEHALEQRARA